MKKRCFILSNGCAYMVKPEEVDDFLKWMDEQGLTDKYPNSKWEEI